MTDLLAIADGAESARPARPDLQEMAEHVTAGGSPLDFVDPPDWFSFSSFDSFERCPRQYALRYLCRVPGEESRPAAEFGSAAHAAFETFTRERRERFGRGEAAPDRADLGLFFDAAFERSSLAVAPEATVWRRRAEQMLDGFWAAESARAAETLCEESRFRLRVDLDADTRVVVGGFIDRIDRLPSGAVELVDYKTGSAWAPDDVESSLQLSIYALGCRDALELGRPERVTLDFVEHGLRYSAERTDEALDNVREGLALRAREIRGSDFMPTPGARACGWCDFVAICPVREKGGGA
jgi:putative RecB family exonuclease